MASMSNDLEDHQPWPLPTSTSTRAICRRASRSRNGVAIDTETLGLNPHRDRLCLVQLSGGDGDAHLVQFDAGKYAAPHLKAAAERPEDV